MLNAEQWRSFSEARAPALVQSGEYTPILSQLRTLEIDKSTDLPEGDWHFVVERPSQAAPSARPILVSIAVKSY